MMINFHRDCEQMLGDDSDAAQGVRLAVHVFKGDATKTHAWKHHKVQSLHIKSSYIFNLDDRDGGAGDI